MPGENAFLLSDLRNMYSDRHNEQLSSLYWKAFYPIDARRQYADEEALYPQGALRMSLPFWHYVPCIFGERHMRFSVGVYDFLYSEHVSRIIFPIASASA